ncbi:MAG: type II 3-dehydroquinate dehydratase [Elusimicrobiota bacterium]|nr:MAG: type II 3-dehydroquinate dehydratase [Elusimicrobiota bacterium]
MNILILHGPNLNLLGEREPSVYGTMTLGQLNAKIMAHGKKRKISMRARQSNHEGGLIDILHAHRRWADGIVFNPGAYSHYSYALRDAVSSIAVPTIEVHLSDITQREAFRRVSVVAPACEGQISGKGVNSYLEAVDRLAGMKRKKR